MHNAYYVTHHYYLLAPQGLGYSFPPQQHNTTSHNIIQHHIWQDQTFTYSTDQTSHDVWLVSLWFWIHLWFMAVVWYNNRLLAWLIVGQCQSNSIHFWLSFDYIIPLHFPEIWSIPNPSIGGRQLTSFMKSQGPFGKILQHLQPMASHFRFTSKSYGYLLFMNSWPPFSLLHDLYLNIDEPEFSMLFVFCNCSEQVRTTNEIRFNNWLF